MAMATFEIEDKFMNEIDKLIKKTGQYKTRSEFFKDSVRMRFTAIEEIEWRKKFREETDKMSKEAYAKGYKGGFITPKQRDKYAREYIKENKIQLDAEF